MWDWMHWEDRAMWSKLGWLLLLAGLLAFGAIFTGVAPVSMGTLPVPLWAWLAVSGFGGFIVMLNRRPNN